MGLAAIKFIVTVVFWDAYSINCINYIQGEWPSMVTRMPTYWKDSTTIWGKKDSNSATRKYSSTKTIIQVHTCIVDMAKSNESGYEMILILHIIRIESSVPSLCFKTWRDGSMERDMTQKFVKTDLHDAFECSLSSVISLIIINLLWSTILFLTSNCLWCFDQVLYKLLKWALNECSL